MTSYPPPTSASLALSHTLLPESLLYHRLKEESYPVTLPSWLLYVSVKSSSEKLRVVDEATTGISFFMTDKTPGSSSHSPA
ncbi:hypothetical protein Tco_0860920 [Tanacetum coccineum]|uniref:Uncharacterized protein n=1 Tax=Tanacetum coccineum TaxID=301880 RepID=A0ABQ5BK08_9ASTR